MVVKCWELYEPSPLTGTVDVNAGAPEHVALLGPNTLNVNVPVGLDPPLRLTLSKISSPTVVFVEAVDRMTGVASAGAGAALSRITPPNSATAAATRPPQRPITARMYHSDKRRF